MPRSYSPDPADGWVEATQNIPFMVHVGPVWHRRRGARPEYGFMPSPGIHGNLYGRLHGGMIAAFADYALGHACWLAAAGEAPAVPHVTVQLGLEYLAAGTTDAWTRCEVETMRRTRSLAFMRGEIYAGETLIVTASGVWKAVNRAASDRKGG